MWQQLRGVSQIRAVIDVAYNLGTMNEQTHRWLLRETGEHKRPNSDLPDWRPDERGQLFFRGKPIRRVRIISTRSNIQRILDAFQKACWPHRIENPFPKVDQHQLHQTLRSLNRGLSKIRFGSQEGGRAVIWCLLNSQSRPSQLR
jgi:hypothetical protein